MYRPWNVFLWWRLALRFVLPRLGILRQYSPRPIRLKTHPTTPWFEKPPSFSLVTPVIGAAPWVGQTVQSVLDQGVPDLEYFVEDGGADAATRGILRGLESRLSGWHTGTDAGQTQAINQGFSRTRGEIMAWLNADDYLLPGALSCVAHFFAKHPEVDVVYGHRVVINAEGHEIGRWVLPGHDDHVMPWADYVPQETLFWRRRIWERVGGQLDERFQFAMDWDLLLRFRAAGAKFHRLPCFIGAFRVHPLQKTTLLLDSLGVEEMTRLRKRELGFVPGYPQILRHQMFYMLRHLGCHVGYRLGMFRY